MVPTIAAVAAVAFAVALLVPTIAAGAAVASKKHWPVPPELAGTWRGSAAVAYGSPEHLGVPFVCLPEDGDEIVIPFVECSWNGTTFKTAARPGANATIDGTVYLIPGDSAHSEGFVAWEDDGVMTLDDGSGNPDCIKVGLISDNHIRVVVLDSVAVDRCNVASYHGYEDSPVCSGSFATGDFVASKVADLFLVSQ